MNENVKQLLYIPEYQMMLFTIFSFQDHAHTGYV